MRRAVIWGVPVLVALVFVVSTIQAASANVVLTAQEASANVVFGVVMATVVTILALVGAVLTDRAPTSRIGAWLLVASILITAGLALASYAKTGQAASPDPWPGAAVAATLGIFPNVFGIGIVLIWVPAIFPTGTLLSPRWRYLMGLSVVALLTTCLSQVFPGGTDADPGAKAMADALSAFSSLTLVIGFIGALSAVVIRFRRGSPIEREQTKWFLAAVAFSVIAFLAAFAVPQDTPAGIMLYGFALAAPPVAIGIAVLRYRLYTIDRIVSRTIAYALITAVLVIVYGAVVLTLRAVVGGLTGGGSAGVALSTLVVASLFQPVRRRIQSAVDHQFDRRRYDAERTVAAFSAQLRDEVHLEAVVSELVATVRMSVAPTASGIWLRSRGPGGR